MKTAYKLLPWFFVALFSAELAAILAPKPEGDFHLQAFGRLPVLVGGRIQPLDSVARNALLQIRSTGDVPLEEVPSWQFWHHPKKLKATEWLLEVMTRPEDADTRPIFLIHHAELVGELKLQDKGLEKSGLRYYTFNDLKPVFSEIADQGQKADKVKSEEQTAFQKQVVKLANAVMLYQRLRVTLQPEGQDDFAGEVTAFERDLEPAAAAMKEGAKFDTEAMRRIAEPIREFQLMAEYGYSAIIPPPAPLPANAGWRNPGNALLESIAPKQIPQPVKWYAAMATANRQQKPAAFNAAVEDYTRWLASTFPKEARKGRAEFFYNQAKLFLHATIIYIFALVLAGVSLLTYGALPQVSESMRRSAYYLVMVAGVAHTTGLIFRMVLEGRPPVTNLYSSAIFIGWGTMVLGLVLERIYRVGIGSIVASIAGFITLLIAHNLALGGDTMEMLRAVLDTNFWLATHVVVITLGYASTFFAGLLAILYIGLGVFTPMLTQKLGARDASGQLQGQAMEMGKALSKMVYGIVCFATLFSFVGTVLGGIWADQSWGRFWGWDPKENGALLIVLWNAIILHARWGGLVRDRGIMNLAVFGNIVTSFSWFGVNMLGIGLHSYGFMDAAFQWLMIFMGAQGAIILLGLLPLNLWRSFRPATAASPSTPPGLGGTPAGTPEPAAS